MAPQPESLLLLLDLMLVLHGVTSPCDVTCSTDYSVSLNCSCSGSAPTHPVLVRVSCRDEELEVHGACDVEPPKAWCVMYPDMLCDVASIGTTCTAQVSRGDGVATDPGESSTWALSDVVKPLPPVDVRVESGDQYNITWDHDNRLDCLTYRVRVRESADLSGDPVYFLSVEQKRLLLDGEALRPRVDFTVDVGAKLCPGILYEGPWSEWSSTAEWRTGGGVEIKGATWSLLYVSASIVSVLGFLGLLSCLRKPSLQRKIRLITFIPKADTFFSPLYHNHEGNFKEWVKPLFDEHDHVQARGEKRHDVLLWHSEGPRRGEDEPRRGGGGGGRFPHGDSDGLSEGYVNSQSHARLVEAEVVSPLDPSASNEQSEGGYRPVDLDAVDSGFGECGDFRLTYVNQVTTRF